MCIEHKEEIAHLWRAIQSLGADPDDLEPCYRCRKEDRAAVVRGLCVWCACAELDALRADHNHTEVSEGE